MIESDLFDIVGHIDLPVRAPSLRPVVRSNDYQHLVHYLENTDTVPELNRGALSDSGGVLHPQTEAIEHFADADVSFVIGTDSHVHEHVSVTLDRIEHAIEGLNLQLAGPDRVLSNQEP